MYADFVAQGLAEAGQDLGELMSGLFPGWRE
jgi:hypothetical protein